MYIVTLIVDLFNKLFISYNYAILLVILQKYSTRWF